MISAEEGKLTMLDSAQKVVLAEGDSVTLSGKTVSIEYIESNGVKFNVDGVVTKTLGNHGYVKLSDGSYIVANEIMYASKESGISKVEFSIGAGQMILEDNAEIEVNTEAVDGLEVLFDDSTNTSATGLNSLTFVWKADEKTFLTKENAITMPAPFDSIMLAFNGLSFPSSSEKLQWNQEYTYNRYDNYKLPFIWWMITLTLLIRKMVIH